MSNKKKELNLNLGEVVEVLAQNPIKTVAKMYGTSEGKIRELLAQNGLTLESARENHRTQKNRQLSKSKPVSSVPYYNIPRF